jgi:hypothetical protein
MSLYNNNLNDLLNNKVWNDFNQKLHDDRINNIVSGSKYTNAQNIYNDPRGTLLEQDNYIQKGLRTQYDELLLRQIDQPYMVDEYGDNYIAPRDMSLFTTLNKQPINVSGYIVDNNAVKRYATAVTPKARVIRNDFDYKLLRAINLKNK